MRVFLTGATGFIGSRIARSLVHGGYTVCALVRATADTTRLDAADDVNRITGDLSDPESWRPPLADFAPEAIIHAAWYAVPGRYMTSDANLDCVRQTLGLLEAARDLGCRRFVGTGTCAEYDWAHSTLRESHTPCEPRSLYGAAKRAAGMLADRFCLQHDISSAWARLFFPYGPGDYPDRLVPACIRALSAGSAFACSVGTQQRDFIHVDDVADAIVAVAASDVAGPVNIGTGTAVAVREVVQQLADIIGPPGTPDFGARPLAPDDPPLLVADATRLTDEVGYMTRIPLHDGLRRTVAAWSQQGEPHE